MDLVTCSCGSTLFENIITMEFDKTDFRVWSYASKLVPAVSCIPVAKCLACGRITIPSTSMMGKHNGDPEVKAYAQLIDIADKINKAISDRELNVAIDLAFFANISNRLDTLENKVCGCKAPEITQELKDLRSEKASKSAVSNDTPKPKRSKKGV
jgi:hypothetical protein